MERMSSFLGVLVFLGVRMQDVIGRELKVSDAVPTALPTPEPTAEDSDTEQIGGEEGTDGDQNDASTAAQCRSLYVWNDFIGTIDGRVYTGIGRVGDISSLDTPVYDNEYLEGNPIAVLRGSMIDDMVANFATGTLAYTFYDNDDQLVVHFGVSTQLKAAGPKGNYGIPLGGTDKWTEFEGFVSIQRASRQYESPSITNYTICAE